MDFFWGVDQHYRVSDKKIILAILIFEKKAKTPGKLFTGCSDTLSQSIGRGRIRRARSLVVRESRNWSDKVFAKKNVLLAYFLNRAETAIPRPPRNTFFFGRWRANFWGGITSKLAGQYPSWGIYKHAPTAFWRKRLLLYIYIEKRWPN